MATEDDVRRIALSLPEVIEKSWFGTPGFRVKDKGFLRIRSEAEGGLVVFVGDLDHIIGKRVTLPADLVGPTCPPLLNARFFLSGGGLTGLPAMAHGGLLRDVLWTFAHDTYEHVQKLTDTIVFARNVPAGRYHLSVTTDGQTTHLPLDLVADGTVSVTLANEDDCPEPVLPDYKLVEQRWLFEAIGLTGFNPTVKGKASTGIRGRTDRKILRTDAPDTNPAGSVCDDICPGFQAESD